MRMLLIEDNSDHYELIRDAFHDAFNTESEIEWHSDFLSGYEKLQHERFDVCLCDLQLPDSSIEASITRLQRLDCETPIVVLTSLNDIDTGTALVTKGVQDYLPKDELTSMLLHRVVAYAIERKKQQVALENKNHNQQIFCATLSHDFKGPVRRIGTLSNFLREALGERSTLTEKEEEWFDYIQHSVATIQQLVDNLQNLLSLENRDDKKDAVDLEQLIERVDQWMKENEKAQYSLSVIKPLPEIYGWESELFILCQNLLTNAVKFTRRFPEIVVRAEYGNDNEACISVEDNGIGIEQKHLEDIFSPFTRFAGESQFVGTGLGLSIVKRIVEIHQARIHVQSELGKGSKITLCFPPRE